MAEVAFEPQTLTELIVTLAGSEYSDAFSSCKLAPNQAVNTFKGGKRNLSSLGRPAYAITATVGQDLAPAASLVNYLWAHAGEEVAMTFTVNGGAVVTAQVIVPAPEVGGDVDALLSTALTFPVQGKPSIAPAA